MSYSSPTTLHTLLSHHCWTLPDDCISTLADKLRNLGSKQTLGVQLRYEYPVIDSLPVDYKRFLPKFRKRGRARIAELLGRLGPGASCLFSLTRVMLPSDSDPSELLDRTRCITDRSDTRRRHSQTWDFRLVLRAYFLEKM